LRRDKAITSSVLRALCKEHGYKESYVTNIAAELKAAQKNRRTAARYGLNPGQIEISNQNKPGTTFKLRK